MRWITRVPYASGPEQLNGSSYQGTWISYTGGQTLTGVYHPPNSNTTSAGNLTIQFSSATTGTLTLPNGKQIQLQRFAF